VGFRRVRVKKLRRDEKRYEVRKSWEKSWKEFRFGVCFTSFSKGEFWVFRNVGWERFFTEASFSMSRPPEDEMSRDTLWYIVIQWDINGILMGY
jgi:hypothetical protein